MHLLNAKPGGFDDGNIIDLEQDPATVVVLSAADTEIALLAQGLDTWYDNDGENQYPSVRLANWLNLRNHASVDLYTDKVLRHASLVIVSLLGGPSYWAYGMERLSQLTDGGTRLLVLPGDDHADERIFRMGTESPHHANRLWRYLREGGGLNALSFWQYLGHHFFQFTPCYQEVQSFAKVFAYWPQQGETNIRTIKQNWTPGQAVAGVLFYRAHCQTGNTTAFDDLIKMLCDNGINVLPIAINSLKDAHTLSIVRDALQLNQAQILLATTGFSTGLGGQQHREFFNFLDIPHIQLLIAGCDQSAWQDNPAGLAPSDLAMQVALPEMDGRIISRAISFKNFTERHRRSQTPITRYRLHRERAAFCVTLAKSWIRLRRTPNPQKHIALVVANYPNKDGRVANGVGLDTPASLMTILGSLRERGYQTGPLPNDAGELMHALLATVTNDMTRLPFKHAWQRLSLDDYRRFYATLPQANRQAVEQRWGQPHNDPMVQDGFFPISGFRMRHVFLGVQPARGYHLDLKACYHDPDLVPPHAYLAFYFWIRFIHKADAVVHVGKHGNMEWLPGKSVALSESCWPEAVFGPLPHIYPFIVNDPGEGTQAKRRAQAVIIDHLTPPLARAQSYGPLRELEQLMDEYYEAVYLDPKRGQLIQEQLREQYHRHHLDRETGAETSRDDLAWLSALDNYLCDIKESQIRHGLHIFGTPVADNKLAEFILALARLPQPGGKNDQGLLHALCRDLELPAGYDPLQDDFEQPWQYPKPQALQQINDRPWRHHGHTRERLEQLALTLIEQLLQQRWPPQSYHHTTAVLRHIEQWIIPRVQACAGEEMHGLLHALDGGYIAPGPSGAPSRGRLDVLPTGKNFHSVDTRAIPTVTAWQLGFKAADLLIQRYVQDHGEYPGRIGLSVWGTATMRTGGDDLAQAFALLGVRPRWDDQSHRVVDFEILPLSVLGRPRVDVMLRISGFFRDAFPHLIDLFDRAVAEVAGLHESEGESEQDNPVAAHVDKATALLRQKGLAAEAARRRARFRIFGSKPGAYGAGLQGLIDERHWRSRADLAEAYLNWGGFAYGQQVYGHEGREDFARTLADVDVVLQNQDNREHDILDSDDYYQFQGGMAAAVSEIRGRSPQIYHGDHANPTQPRIRSLQQELSRVIRSRVLNPKWINAMREHGYKGGFEMAATVDYLFAYDATTDTVADHQYALVTDALLMDRDNREFLEQNNPDALREMAERMLEAMQRGLWQQPGDYRQAVEGLILDGDRNLESGD